MKPTHAQREAIREWIFKNPFYQGALSPKARTVCAPQNRWYFGKYVHHSAQADIVLEAACRFMSLVDFPQCEDDCCAIMYRVARGRSTGKALEDRAIVLWRGLTGADTTYRLCGTWRTDEEEWSEWATEHYGFTPVPPRSILDWNYCWVCGLPIFKVEYPIAYCLVHDTPIGKRGRRCRSTSIYRGFNSLRGWKKTEAIKDLVERTASSPDVYHLVRLQLSIYGVHDEIDSQAKQRKQERVGQQYAGRENKQGATGCAV